MSDMTGAKRSPGLDLARTLAISGVLCAHFPVFFSHLGIGHERLMPLYIWGGHYGVELFFVLSGYLIGGILIRDVLPAPSPCRMMIFCVRRWLRTLPAYYTVLLCFILYAHGQGVLPGGIWKYVFFLQNAPPDYAGFFPVSWSLSIEEWSYLFILVLLFFPFVRRSSSTDFRDTVSGKPVIAKLVAAMVFFLLLRVWMAFSGPAMWDAMFRKQVLFRLDAVLYGILAFSVKHWYPSVFKKISAFGVFCGSVVLLQCVYLNHDVSLFAPEGNLFAKSLGFSTVSALMALVLCFLDENPRLRRLCAPDAILGRFWLWGSRLAYSLYLVHLSVFNGISVLFSSLLGNPYGILLAMGVAVLSSIGVSFVLYTFIEKPGMNLRRHFILTPPAISSTDAGTGGLPPGAGA